MSAPAVQRTQELDRIQRLPRRVICERDAEAWAHVYTQRLRLPGSRARLRPWQGYCLAEAAEVGGGFFALPVGAGKTLLSYLLPIVLGAQRPVLIVPASLRQKAYDDFTAFFREWRAGPVVQVWSREELALEQNRTRLDDYAPDCIVIDEADELANPRSAAVRRIDRYLRSHDASAVTMTGTPARKSIMGYWHQLCWTLGDGAPVPLCESEARQWAAVLDTDGGGRPGAPRMRPGALGRTREAARAWYRDRLAQTPGVVLVDRDSCDAPLTIRARLAREDAVLDAAFERFLIEQSTPGGVEVSDPLSRWLLDAQLGLGLYTRYCPEPPDEWREARRDVARFVRAVIERSSYSSRPLDTEGQVMRRFADHQIVRRWLDVKPTFAGTTEAIWISESALDSVEDWLREIAPDAGIVWCGSVDFALRLAERTGLPYYHRQGRTAEGDYLQHADGASSIICSWGANKRGFDLQRYRRQLITMPPQSAKWLEQIFGRSHRAGQTEHVEIDVLMTSGGTIDALASAIEEARTARDRETLTQKILRAQLIPAEPRITPRNRFRWATRTKKEEKVA